MSHLLYRKAFSYNEAFPQKCLMPHTISNVNFGDYAQINCGSKYCICRVFPHFMPDNSVSIDDTVSYYTDFSKVADKKDRDIFDISQNFKFVKIYKIVKVDVKIVFQEISKVQFFSQQYRDIVSKLLEGCVVTKNAIIKCTSRKLADLFKIECIVIEDVTFDVENHTLECACGRISRTTLIEIAAINSIQQFKLKSKILKQQLGHMSDEIEHLKLNIKICKRILILGPNGSGKSTLLKSFCCNIQCFFLLIDGNSNITLDKCQQICSELISFSKTFPKQQYILCIDNIDKLENTSFKQTNNFDLVTYLVKSLDSYNITIIAVTTHKDSLGSYVSSLFETEVFLGVLSFTQRKKLISTLFQNLHIKDFDCDYIAERTSGFMAGDLKLLIDTLFSTCMKKFNQKNEIDFDCLTFEDVLDVLHSVTPSLLKNSKWRLKVKPVFWKEIGGMEYLKSKLQMCIEKPLLNPEIFKKVDLPIPKGVLLFGPPGCCKTTIARGLATECKANFFAANPSQIYSPYVGVAEKNVSELFYEARLCSPSIIFLDELDSLIGCRELENKNVGVAEKVLSTLLVEMDGFGITTGYKESESSTNLMNYSDSNEKEISNDKLNEQVIVVAATNRPDRIDDALLRPGRFDVILYVPPPNAEERESILETYTQEAHLLNVDLRKIAEKTEGYSGADLKHLHNTAALIGLHDNENLEYITHEHYMKALESVKPSITHKQIKMYEQLSIKYGTLVT